LSLQSDLLAARNHIQWLESEFNAAKEKSNKLSKEVLDAHATTNKRDGELRLVKNRIAHLESEIDRLNKEKPIRESLYAAQINNVMYERLKLENSIQGYQSEIQALKAENKSLNEKVKSTAADNARLRRDIVNMENDLNPLREEDFYIQGFREIKTDIEMWAATYASNDIKGLSANEETFLLQNISTIGPRGKASADILSKKNVAQKLYKNARCRIPFVRHIIALFLYDNIFEPFAFGFTSSFSQVLSWIDSDIVSYGLFLYLCSY
jgi:predicted  nucleic acid-binding Zn-ribbon protein